MTRIDPDWVGIGILLTLALLLLLQLWFSRDRCPLAPRGRHKWDYGSRGIGGWGCVRCARCGKEDIY